MTENNIKTVRSIVEIAESLSENERAILMAYGEGIAAASELHRSNASSNLGRGQNIEQS